MRNFVYIIRFRRRSGCQNPSASGMMRMGRQPTNQDEEEMTHRQEEGTRPWGNILESRLRITQSPEKAGKSQQLTIYRTAEFSDFSKILLTDEAQ